MRFENQKFLARRVLLDGNQFIECQFERCLIVYAASAATDLKNNNFTNCEWSFEGAAARTMDFLKGLYFNGGKDLVQETILAMFSAENNKEASSNKNLH